jgi:hypothetical protein
VFGVFGVLVPVMLIHGARWQFGRQVQVGMQQEQVINAVGHPDKILQAGSILDSWGNGQKRTVHSETWIYGLLPSMASRAVVTFSGQTVVSVEFQYN